MYLGLFCSLLHRCVVRGGSLVHLCLCTAHVLLPCSNWAGWYLQGYLGNGWWCRKQPVLFMLCVCVFTHLQNILILRLSNSQVDLLTFPRWSQHLGYQCVDLVNLTLPDQLNPHLFKNRIRCFSFSFTSFSVVASQSVLIEPFAFDLLPNKKLWETWW